jgi:hypothetical protein
MWLVGTAYNFCWPHDSLRRLAPDHSPRKWFLRTPAMAAGLTDRPWTISELLRFQVPLPRWVTIAGVQEMAIPDGLVWDNAPSHRDDEITDLDLGFVGLPPYSPELNPAERLFEEIRRLVEGKVYATLDANAEVQAFLEALDADPPRVRRLCGWDWVNAAVASVPGRLENAA